jgi:similar to stage IV sporulation protein
VKRGDLYIKIQVLGEDSFSLIEKLHKNGICAYDITFFDKKTILSIDFLDRKKFFAISRNMCYNISILKYCGKFSLVARLVSNVGLLVCFGLFFALAIAFDGYVSKICYEGDGEYFAPQILELFQNEGVKENTLLKADLKSLENKLLLEVDGLSYVSLKKSGRILTVEAYRSEQKIESVDLNKPKITATISGKVRAINLLSGTALVNVGDEVKKGDTLIDGYVLKGEEKQLTHALGEVEIEVKYVFTYQSFASGERYKNRACVLARESLGEKNVLSQEVKESSEKGKIVYTVTLYYLVTVS